VSRGLISVDGKSFGEDFICENAGLRQTVHALPNLHVNIAVV
jgi:hypothetical protein